MAYNIKLEQFKGPLELLLKFIEEEMLDVTSVSLAKVADQYLDYISHRENIGLENLANFLTIASRLILIKSKALLPFLELTDEEEKEIKDLEFQLQEYKKFKEITQPVRQIFDSSRISFSREGFSGFHSFFFPPENINALDLKKTFLKILEEIPLLEKLEEEMVREVVTLEEKINYIQSMFKDKIITSFSEIVVKAENKVDVIVSFLAILELVKQRIIEAEQGEMFNEIKLKHINRN